MKFEHADVFNLENALRGMRNPMNSWEKGNLEDDLKLGAKLSKAGASDRKFLRQIFVSIDIIVRNIIIYIPDSGKYSKNNRFCQRVAGMIFDNSLKNVIITAYENETDVFLRMNPPRPQELVFAEPAAGTGCHDHTSQFHMVPPVWRLVIFSITHRSASRQQAVGFYYFQYSFKKITIGSFRRKLPVI